MKADVVIVDITRGDSDKFFLAGYAFAQGKKVFTIAEHGSGIPYSLQTGPSYLFYDPLKIKEDLSDIPRLIRIAPSEIKYCSAFIAYGDPDVGFAERLKMDLQDKGVLCWLYSTNYTVGQKTWPEIIQRRREAEKMIVLCSSNSLIRDGLRKEIEEQMDEDPDKMIPVSLDPLWKEKGFLIQREGRDLKPFLLDKNYADFQSESMYKESLEKLLKGLQRKN